MTKMQIVAKAVLTVLGIYAVVNSYRFYPGQYMYSSQQPSTPLELLFLSAFTIMVAIIAYFMIFNNTRLSIKMAGPGQQLDPQTQAAWLAKSLYIAIVLAGLLLLPNSINAIIKLLRIPFIIHPAINEIIQFKRFPAILVSSYRLWYKNIYDLLKAILAVYLICGAPHFIRWQKKKSLPAINLKGVENE